MRSTGIKQQLRSASSLLLNKLAQFSLCAVLLVVMQLGLSVVPASAQNIEASPSALSATVAKGQSTSLTLNLRKSGSDQHVWEPKTSVAWITLTPGYGSSNTTTTEQDVVRVNVDTTNLAQGNNSALVYIWDTAPGVSRVISVPVTVTVTQGDSNVSPQPTPPPPPPPAPPSPPPASPAPALQSNLTASPSALAATVPQGQSTTFTLNLQKAGTAQHVWEPKTSVPWLTLTPGYGSINTVTTELDKLQVTANTAGMNLGSNQALVYVWESAPGMSRVITVPVSITVTASGEASQSTTQPPPPPPPAKATATVTWSPNSEADLAGYKVHVGTQSGNYTQILDVGNTTSYAISLPKGVTYFFAVTAYDKAGNQSDRSAELSRSLF